MASALRMLLYCNSSRICGLWYSNMCYGNIAAQVSHLGVVVNRPIVQTTRRREIDRVDNVTKPRSGRPRVNTNQERDQAVDIIQNDDPFTKWRDLIRACELAHEKSV